MERENDVQLIRKVLSGDETAFAILVDKYQKSVHALVWRKIGDFQDAEEIAQDTFLRAYTKLSTLKNPHQFAGWLYVIANRLCIDWSRKRKLTMQSLEDTPVEEIEEVSYTHHMGKQRQAEITESRQALVKRLLAKLPESERTVVTLYYLGEMTTKEIGKFLGVSVNTITSRLRRGRERLQEQQEEPLVRETLGSIPISADFTEQIMRQVADIGPVPTPVSKPFTPWVALGTVVVVVMLMFGVGNQYLVRFQKPYNLDATSEPTVEIIDAVFVYDSPAKPAVRSQAGSSVTPGKNAGAGQKPDESLYATLPVDTVSISTPKPQWIQTEGPEGGNIPNLYMASNGNFYVGVNTNLYRLTDDRSRWGLVNTNMPINGSWQMTERGNALYIVSDTQVHASTDGGAIWNSLGTRPEGGLIDLVMTDEAFWLGLDDGIFRSVDVGKSWISLNNEFLADRKIRAITAIENTVFVGTDSGLYRLSSEGWKLLPVGEDENIQALTSAEHLLYVAVGTEVMKTISPNISARVEDEHTKPVSLYRSIDLGDSWQTLNFMNTSPEFVKTASSEEIGLTINSEPKDSDTETTTFVKIVAAKESILVLDSENSYYSSDAGENWVTLDSKTSDIGDVSALVSLDANTFYRNGLDGIYRTTDAGKTWHQFNTGLVKTGVMNLVSTHDGLYANVGHAIFVSSDNGNTWTPVPDSPGDITNITKSNDILYVRSAEEIPPRLFRLSTENNRLTPIPEMPPVDETDYGELVSERIKKAILATAQDEGKKDIGENTKVDIFNEDHSEIISEVITVELLGAVFGSIAVSGDTYYMGYKQRLFRWKPGMTEWRDTGLVDEVDEDRFNPSLDSFSDIAAFKLAVSGSIVYVGKLDGSLFQSLDEGNTWDDITAKLPFSVTVFNAVIFAGSSVYVATDKGVVYSSDGMHWHATSYTEDIPLVIDRFAVHATSVFGATEKHVYQLEPNSNVWKQVTPEVPSLITSLAVESNVLYVGTSDSGVMRYTLDESP